MNDTATPCPECQADMQAVAYGRAYLCMTCGEALILSPRNKAVVREVQRLTQFVKDGNLIPPDTSIPWKATP